MRAQELTFLELVQGEKQFQVPLYQRTYSWGESQLRQLWRDVLEQGEVAASGAAHNRHFIGSVVLAPSPSLQAGGVQRWLVVDGQQRLTTLMLALAAIRDHLEEVGDARAADRIHRQYLVNEFRRGDDHLRLLPTQADRSAFRTLVLKSPSSVPTGSVTDAYRFFRTVVATADDPDDDEDVAQIEQTVRAGLSIVEITSEHGDNVFRIFESLNNTGLQLSQADLLRNHLFMRMPTRGEDVYNNVWLPMQDRLSNRELELLVWLDLVNRGDDRVKQTEIYRVQQERMHGISSEAEIEAEVGELARRSRHLERILRPSLEPDPALRAALARLAAWGAATAYPLVMHLLDLLERRVTDTEQVTEALAYVESFLVRRMLCQVPTNNLNRVFNASPPAVGQTRDVAAAVRTYLSGRRRYWPTDNELRRSIRTRPFYWVGRWPQRMFVLRRLEESYDRPEPVDFEKAKLTIEHVLPQTLTDEWLELLAADVTEESGPEELHELLVHTLGNLTLTAENARLSNGPLHRKQDIYRASALQMNREIAATTSWGKQEILSRADLLADRALRLWPGPTAGAEGDAEGRDWSLLRRACAALPAGVWTTYGDLAEVIGSHPVPVGGHLANEPVPNAWRVLRADGTVSPGFRWSQADRRDDPRALLEAEGVTFDDGHADPAQHITAVEIAGLLGMEAGEPPEQPDLAADLSAGRGQQFLDQLRADHPDSIDAVRDLLDTWKRLGGRLSFGSGSEVSCFLLLDAEWLDLDPVYPFLIYPRYGGIEVVFEYLRRRPVFEDLALRDEFRRRLVSAGIDIPESKLNLRPSFRVELLQDAQVRARVNAALEWFVLTFQTQVSQPIKHRAGETHDVLGMM